MNTTYQEIEQYLIASGYWAGERRHTHRYILSPEILEVDCKPLDTLAPAIHECLSGFGVIAAIASTPALQKNPTWGRIARLVNASFLGIPNFCSDYALLKPQTVPLVVKVDLMMDESEHFWIAELDAYNPRGMGYGELLSAISRLIQPGVEQFPGIAKILTKEVVRRYGEHARVIWLYADKERWYLPSFEIFKNVLAEHGIEMIVIAESDVAVNGTGITMNGVTVNESTPLVIFPILDNNRALRKTLTEHYQDRKVSFLIPPKPFLGSKMLLALLSNAQQDPHIESILTAHINRSALEKIRSHIPQTILVNKETRSQGDEMMRQWNGAALKRCVSSGMKGLCFQNEPVFEEMYNHVSKTKDTYVLQQLINTAPFRFSYFSDNTILTEGGWHARFIMTIINRMVAEVEVTAQQDPLRVHGAPDSIQIGTTPQ